MKTLNLLLFAVLSTLTASAQLPADGFYRVQNQKTERYISIIDNRGSVNLETTDADLGALRTVMDFSRVVSDPGSIIYLRNLSNGYDLQAQGASTNVIVGYQLRLLDLKNGTYAAYASSHGLTKYLSDAIPSWMMDPEEKIYGTVVTNSAESRYWYIKPVKNADECYFGITPDVTTSDAFYKSFYASFAFSFLSSGMNAYYVTKVDNNRGLVVIKELTGTIPASTPIIVKCSSTKAANNKLNLSASTAAAPSDNMLKGVYFCNPDAGKHTNVLNYSATTMRVLGRAADGSLAFVKQSGLKYVAANSSYITVSVGAPDEMKVVTQAQYDKLLAEEVTVTARSYSRAYGEANPTFAFDTKGAALQGQPSLACTATAISPVGSYPITVSKGSVSNGLTKLVNGVLTITPATLTVTVADAEREQGAENPPFILTYDGFKNGETESVLIMQPSAVTTASADSPAGVYDITVSGGKAQNYSFNYVSGKLTVTMVNAVSGVSAEAGVSDVYDLCGRKILSRVSSLSGLPKGVYVVNGRKVIVK